MAYNPLNPNGQATMANSQPVVIASNQSSILTSSSVIGTVPVTMAGVWIASVVGNVGIIGTPSISGTVNIGNAVTVNPSSVSGTVGASVIGTVPVTQSGAWTTSVVGTLSINPSSVSGTIGASVIGIAPVSLNALNGTAVSTDAGNTNTGTERVVQATASTYNTGQVTIASSATSILGVNVNRIRAVIINAGTNVVYLGNSNAVSSVNGTLLAGIAGYPLSMRTSASVWGTSPAGNQIVTFIEEVH